MLKMTLSFEDRLRSLTVDDAKFYEDDYTMRDTEIVETLEYILNEETGLTFNNIGHKLTCEYIGLQYDLKLEIVLTNGRNKAVFEVMIDTYHKNTDENEFQYVTCARAMSVVDIVQSNFCDILTEIAGE